MFMLAQRVRPWWKAHVSTMLVILLFLFSANGIISTVTEDEAVAIASVSETVFDDFPKDFPNEQGTEDIFPPEYSNTCLENAANNEAVAISSATATFGDFDDFPDVSPIEPGTDCVKPECPDTCNNNGTLTCSANQTLVKCPSYCPSDYCPTGVGQNKKCSQPNPCPPPTCKCRFNYRKTINGECISTRDCPAFDCPNPNEVYDPCPPLCPTDSCSQATPTGKCPLIGRIGIILECNPTCRCKPGYWKVENGTCVPYIECPGKLKCGPNEVVDNCPVDCKSDYCPTSDEPEQSCPKPCKCPPPACKCAFNYRRAPNGTCIPTRECPPFECNKENEVYNSCPSYCPTDDCSQATPDGRCPILGNIGIVVECQPKCRCKEHYWRKDGVCVPYDQCPGKQKCRTGEVLDKCPLLCNTDHCPKDETDVRTCYTPIRCMKPACKCPFNQLRVENGTCIPASDCPAIKCSKPNEVYNSCPPACPGEYCKDATPCGKCMDPGRIGISVECRPGCRCKKGYWRNNVNICVPYGQCKDKRCPFANEEYTDNKVKCPSDRCSSIVERCAPSKTGRPGCVCSSGYKRLDDGKPCMPMRYCPQLANSPDYN